MTIKWDEKTFLEGAKLYYDYTLKNSKKRILGWFFIAILQFGIVMLIKQGTLGMALLGSFLTLYWYFLRWPLRKLALKMQFKNSAMANKNMSIEVNQNGLKVDNQELGYDKISEVIKGKNGYLLAIQNGFIYIPFNKFSKESKKDFENFIKNNTDIKS